jgi:hypothetical protein
MSAVELAVRKVKKLSALQARELLVWLNARQANGKPARRRPQPWWRKGTARQRMRKLRAWEDSVRGTTDWEIPRMPDELVNVDAFHLYHYRPKSLISAKIFYHGFHGWEVGSSYP